MTHLRPAIDLDATRLGIIKKLREIRLDRGWTQAELAARLGLSQARLSVIERGGGTISAEQFIALLALSNVSIDDFLPQANADAAFQNALARLGAHGLREYPDTLPSTRLANTRNAIREILVAPDSPRLVAALAPVLIWNIDNLNLHALHRELCILGLGHRLGWLTENIRLAIESTNKPPKPWAFRERVARVELDAFIPIALDMYLRSDNSINDRFDMDIASVQTAKMVQEASSHISKRWGVITTLQPSDFREALDAAYTSS